MTEILEADLEYDKTQRRQYNDNGARLAVMIRQAIGRLLAEERQRCGLSMEEVAKMAHLRLWKVHKAETGYGAINWSFIAALLNFYGKRFVIELADLSELPD